MRNAQELTRNDDSLDMGDKDYGKGRVFSKSWQIEIMQCPF